MKKRSVILLAVLLIVTLAINIACGSLKTMITSWMGVNLNPMITGSKAAESADVLSVADAATQSLAMAESLEEEGIVLLRNENGALPLAGGAKVNPSGRLVDTYAYDLSTAPPSGTPATLLTAT